MTQESWKPAVPRRGLLIIAGVIWSAVGVMLCLFALTWFSGTPLPEALSLGALGLLAGFSIYRLGFRRIVRKNISRIEQSAEHPCLFSFQSWKSYFLVALMITMGALLRHSTIPRRFLAPCYQTMGLALLLGSLHYYASFRRMAGSR